jgi:hypothetical protein
MTWATLEDGSTVLLGLPAHGNPPQQVIDRTVVLAQDEWRQHCQQALGFEEVHGWSWSKASDAVGNTFEVYAQPTPLDPGVVVSLPDPAVPYCEFVFLPEGWELRVVESQGIIKSEAGR